MNYTKCKYVFFLITTSKTPKGVGNRRTTKVIVTGQYGSVTGHYDSVTGQRDNLVMGVFPDDEHRERIERKEYRK